MKPEQNITSERRYFIDWLRILLIISVFFFHVGMVFVPWEWHVKNNVLYEGALTILMSFLHTWRMPLLFMISGAGTFLALRSISPVGYLVERSKRLLVPLITGIFILVPVQVYIEKSASYSSIVSFYPHMFEGIYPSGNFSWHHLWFIVYLFVIALVISPFLNLLRSEACRRIIERLASFLSKPLRLNLVLIPLLISQIILRMYFEQETHALYNDWATFTFYFIFFIAGLLLLPQESIIRALERDRNIYLAETVVFTAVMFMVPGSGRPAEVISDISEIIVSWTCSVAVAGYAKKYLDFNSGFRKAANEAIYPFYLFHQPLIVIMAFMITTLSVATWIKALLIITSTITAFIAVYACLIRPFSLPRVLFGMKPVKKERKMIERLANHGSNEEAERA